ncbi:MAG: peptidoglycan-binding domain-containing protein [Geminicoccaceae bacterium]
MRDLGTSNGEFFFITGDRLSSAPGPDNAGDAGPDERLIVEAQEILAGLGYDPGPRDGILGLRTQGALRRFQAENGLPVTGEPDATLSALVDPWAAKPCAIVVGEATVSETVAKGEPPRCPPRRHPARRTGQSLLAPADRDPPYAPGDRFRDCSRMPGNGGRASRPFRWALAGGRGRSLHG